MDKFRKILLLFVLLLITQLTIHCQMLEKTPEFRTEISHPDKKYRITPVYDHIKTLENTPASLPYGSSSGEWASSGKGWTEQHGTPIGFEITYYAHCENKYYYIDQNFDVEHMKEMTNRCYAGSDMDSETPVKEYIYKKEWRKIQANNDVDTSYDEFGTLVFGFAPQGMVVVWMRYGGANCIELGRYQAKEITDKAKIEECKQKYISTYRLGGNRYEEQIEEMKIPDASSKLWDNYRIKYNWNYEVTSDNKEFRLLSFDSEYYNGEVESLFRPVVLKPEMKKRGIPEIINLYFETSKKERYIGRFFFDWDKMNELMKSGGEKQTLKFHIDEDSNNIEVMLNNQKIEIDSIRIYPNSSMRFRDSFGGPYSD
jgi:hypothetical protein